MTNTSQTVGSSIHTRIKNDIISGTLKPGTKLKLDTLKIRYAASVSTLRETLNRLTSEGFVEAPEQRGFLVSRMSREDLTELSNLRILLECTALKASIAFGDDEWEGNLASAHHKLATLETRVINGEDVPSEQRRMYDWIFHFSLVKACNSQNLINVFENVFERYIRYQVSIFPHRCGKTLMEHKEIFDAALSRDSELASEKLKTHLRKCLSFSLSGM